MSNNISRYIDESILIEKLHVGKGLPTISRSVLVNCVLPTIPTANVRENVKGEWIFDGQRHRGGIKWCHCSVCGNEENADYAIVQGVNYCPNCGADMRENER